MKKRVFPILLALMLLVPGTMRFLKSEASAYGNSFATATHAPAAYTPTVDGVKDAIYSETSKISATKVIKGGARADRISLDAYMVHDGQTLYIYFEAVDDTVAQASSPTNNNANDAVHLNFFTSEGSAICGTWYFNRNSEDNSKQNASSLVELSSSVGPTDTSSGAWSVEVSLPLYSVMGKDGLIAFDFFYLDAASSGDTVHAARLGWSNTVWSWDHQKAGRIVLDYEEVTTVNAASYSPSIDGAKDSVYSSGRKLATHYITPNSGTGVKGSAMDIYVVHDGEYLYFYFEVISDTTPKTPSSVPSGNGNISADAISVNFWNRNEGNEGDGRIFNTYFNRNSPTNANNSVSKVGATNSSSGAWSLELKVSIADYTNSNGLVAFNAYYIDINASGGRNDFLAVADTNAWTSTYKQVVKLLPVGSDDNFAALPYRNSAPTLDGIKDASYANTLSMQIDTPFGSVPSGTGALGSAYHDGENIYLFYEITDSSVKNSESGSLTTLAQDTLMLVLFNGEGEFYTSQHVFFRNSASNSVNGVIPSLNISSEVGTLKDAQNNTVGYTVEIVLPISKELISRNGLISLDTYYFDYNEQGQRLGYLSWSATKWQYAASRAGKLSLALPAFIEYAALPSGAQGSSYSANISVLFSQSSSFTFFEKSNVLSQWGLTLSSSGTLSGTPTRAGELCFTVAVDNGFAIAEREFILSISHTHSWSSTWSKNETHHWHECANSDCDAAFPTGNSGYAAHVFDRQNTSLPGALKSAADCTNAAVYYKSCVCGEIGSDTFTSGQPLGHSYTDILTPSTCTEQGYTTHTCSRCAHVLVDSYTPPHSTLSWNVLKNASLTSMGIKTRSCPVCNMSESDNIPMLLDTTSGWTLDNGFFTPSNLNGYKARIPSLLTVGNGVVLAAIDRGHGEGDYGDISIVVRRSTDGGKTWGAYQTLIDPPQGSAASVANRFQAFSIDVSMTYDAQIGRTVLFTSFYPESHGNWSDSTVDFGTGYAYQGGEYRLILRNHTLTTQDDLSTRTYTTEYYLGSNGTVYDAQGNATAYTVPSMASGNLWHDGTIYKNGTAVGNIFLYTGANAGELSVMCLPYLLVFHSNDNGLSWEDPFCINASVKPGVGEKYFGVGPGKGIQLSSGRLVVPCWGGTGVCLVYSDDHGASWTRGGYLPKNQLPTGMGMSEAQVVELDGANGGKVLKMFGRSNGNIYIATSTNGGVSWSSIAVESEIPNPDCQISVISLPYEIEGYENKQLVLLSGCDSSTARNNGQVWLGVYDELTDSFEWVAQKRLFSASWWYSCLTVLPDNRIGVIFETSTSATRYAHFHIGMLFKQ